ncbi:hypothetical protein [Acidianus manzaensis]|nr:hypothetical protein [Acidianus manzaensis]
MIGHSHLKKKIFVQVERSEKETTKDLKISSEIIESISSEKGYRY